MENQEVSSAQQKLPLKLSAEERLQKLVRENDLIFSGVIIKIGPPPEGWSGFFVAYQNVVYRIEQIFKGSYGAPEISVDHVVVHGSKTAQAGNQPGLSSTLFSEGHRLIVFAEKAQDGSWKSLSESMGALMFSDESVAMLQSALKS